MHFDTMLTYVRRSPYQAMAAISIMTLTFFMISVFSLLTILSLELINFFEKSPQVTFFFRDEAKVEEIMDVKKQLDSSGKVANIKYISKEAALEIYKKVNEDDNPILLELVTSDILPASLEIQTHKPEDLDEIAIIGSKSKLVETVAYPKDVIETFISWMNAFKSIGLAIVSVLVVTSVLVIFTIIAFKILVRKEEIEIMRLLGATSGFVRVPFLYEGLLYGFFGALLGWTLSLAMLAYATPFLQEKLRNIPIFPVSPSLLGQVLAGEIVAACFIGIISSYIAVLRYLK